MQPGMAALALGHATHALGDATRGALSRAVTSSTLNSDSSRSLPPADGLLA